MRGEEWMPGCLSPTEQSAVLAKLAPGHGRQGAGDVAVCVPLQARKRLSAWNPETSELKRTLEIIEFSSPSS